MKYQNKIFLLTKYFTLGVIYLFNETSRIAIIPEFIKCLWFNTAQRICHSDFNRRYIIRKFPGESFIICRATIFFNSQTWIFLHGIFESFLYQEIMIWNFTKSGVGRNFNGFCWRI